MSGPRSTHPPADPRRAMLDGLPVEQRRLRLAGVPTVVLTGGEGSPLVLLHGGIETGGAMWEPVIAELATRHRLIVPDAPGLGESAPATRLDAATFSAWFVAVLRLAGNERPMLVAHSLLGSMAARFAARHGDRLDRLVLYGAPAAGPYRMPPGLMLTAIRFALRPSERNSERFERWAFHDLDATRGRDPRWWAAFDRYLRERAAVGHVKRTMRQLIKTETKQLPADELARITVRTDLLWGELDRMVPLRIGQRASAAYGWPLHVINGVGHAPHVERPAEFLAALDVVLGADHRSAPGG